MARTVRRVGVIAVILGGAFAGSVQADPTGPEFDWHGTGGCQVPVVGMPTHWRNVEPYVPESQRSKVIVAGNGDTAQATLIFVFIRCPHSLLDTDSPDVRRDNVVQVLTGVLYDSRGLDDVNHAQFYLLASAINWRPFVDAELGLGSPTDYVPGVSLVVNRDGLSGLGTFGASVPRGRAPLTASGTILAPNPFRELPQDATHFFEGPYGLIHVAHHESWAPGNDATATITAQPGSFVASLMGATSRDAEGLYVWIHDELHVHQYRIVP
jgi:hypothetical protein